MCLCILHEERAYGEKVNTRQEGDRKICCILSNCWVLFDCEVDFLQEEEWDKCDYENTRIQYDLLIEKNLEVVFVSPKIAVFELLPQGSIECVQDAQA